MMNNIILNGVNSNTIQGLIIQELPPISKPAIRTEIEEIDGRDGDVITKLGYAAYDKQLSIGLYGNYDINQVISFFNTSGTVIFSNEPDKYYNYQILNEIDFERLVRFRTAIVTMHVQPFKYSTTETPQELSGTVITGEGSNISLVNTTDSGLFTDLQKKGDTFQQTYSGKNLFNINASSGTYHATRTMSENNLIITPNGNYARIEYSFPNLIAGNIYTLTINYNNPNNNSIRTAIYEGSTEKSTSTTTTSSSGSYKYTFTANTDTKIRFYANTLNSTVTTPMTYYNIQLEEGTTATNYEPYVGETPSPNPDYPQEIKTVTGNCSVVISNEDSSESQTYPISLGNIELCMINGTEDYIYKNNGTWYLHKAIGKFVLNGSENWNVNTNQELTNTIYLYSNVIDGLNTGSVLISNHFTNASNLWNNDIQGIQLSTNAGNIRIRINKTLATGATTFKNWLSTHNTDIYYLLATPTDTEITDSTLLSQLNSLGNATTYLGTTNISTSGDGLSPILYVETVAVDDPTLKITNSGNTTAKPIMTLYGTGTINLSLNGEQIFVIDLSSENYITIDIANMEAYYNGILKNRLVTGNYENFVLNQGENEITFTGTLYSLTISNYSRWI